MNDPNYIGMLEAKRVVNIKTGKPTTLADLQNDQKIDQSNHDRAEKLMKDLNVKIVDMFNLQVGIYVAALVSNGVFIAVNYIR